jgi:hypothetical protein
MWPFGRVESDDQPAPDERRKFARHGVGAPTMVVLPGQPGVRAFIRDISKGGCLLDTEARVPVGATLSLSFLIKPSSHCHAAGSVVRVSEDRHFGVHFTRVNMAFLGFVGAVSAASPEARAELIAAIKGSLIEVSAGP